MPQQVKLKIKSNELIADKIYKLVLAGDYDLDDYLPGKFLHIKCSDSSVPLLRRPMSVCNIDDAGKEMVVLYRADGEGTKILAARKAGDLLDTLAPLGVHFPIEEVKAGDKILLIGGGIGVPPLYYLGRKLKQRGALIKSILGFNSGKDVFYEKEFSELGKTLITTIDGTHGHKGLVTDLMDNSYDFLYTCGPTAMLKAVQAKSAKAKLGYMSLEERMGCGIGACLACVSKSTDPNCTSYNRVCTEGPVFAIDAIKL
ncbi:MAG: dihydroorotate dehydrogenase electron transfer subunit [Cyanobacteria bacterium]|nr:dihydroorotate dehydrogenase electron transfer subunit [Cyanobacteriota bacterium]MDA1020671.1 dihydroorotate dehydrogenase electron transfer subunit [Cyanobacteriota bacterium]